MNEWQPIETAPKDGVKPLLISDGGFTYVGWWDESLYGKDYPWIFWDHDGTNGFSEESVTHWMPLPEPPK